jgi:hypothetical protein
MEPDPSTTESETHMSVQPARSHQDDAVPADLSGDFRRIRALTEQLCKPLAIEDYML